MHVLGSVCCTQGELGDNHRTVSDEAFGSARSNVQASEMSDAQVFAKVSLTERESLRNLDDEHPEEVYIDHRIDNQDFEKLLCTLVSLADTLKQKYREEIKGQAVASMAVPEEVEPRALDAVNLDINGQDEMRFEDGRSMRPSLTRSVVPSLTKSSTSHADDRSVRPALTRSLVPTLTKTSTSQPDHLTVRPASTRSLDSDYFETGSADDRTLKLALPKPVKFVTELSAPDLSCTPSEFGKNDLGASEVSPLGVSYSVAAPFDESEMTGSQMMRKHSTVRKLRHKVFASGRQLTRPDCVGEQIAVGKPVLYNVQSEVLSPASRFVRTWNCIALPLLFCDLMVLPVEVFEPGYGPINALYTWGTLAFWTTQIPMSMFTGYTDKHGTAVTKKRRTIRKYVRSWFLLDITLIVFDILTAVQIVPLFRFARAIRLVTYRRILNPVEQLVQSNLLRTAWWLLKVFLLIVYCMHAFACGWWAIGYYPTGGWTQFEFGAMPAHAGRSPSYRYGKSMQWAIGIFGFGTSDIYPVTSVEAGYGVFVQITSVGLAMMAFGQVVAGILRLEMLTKTQRMHEETLRNYLLRHSVHYRLRTKIWEVLRTVHKQDSEYPLEGNVKLLLALPRQVMLELRSAVYLPVLKVHPFFLAYSLSEADARPMVQLIQQNGLSELMVQAKEELFHNNEKADSMYFLVEGKLVYKYMPQENFARRGSISIPTRLWSQDWTASRVSSMEDIPQNEEKVVVRLLPVEWLCEAALWMTWSHAGDCSARTPSAIVSIKVSQFHITFANTLPQAYEYAQRFVQFANRSPQRLTDYVNEASVFSEIAEDVFQLTITMFDISYCRPSHGNFYTRNEWDPVNLSSWSQAWSSAWKEGHCENNSALIKAMYEDMKHDVVLAYQTLYAQNLHSGRVPPISSEEQEKHDHTVQFLKRLFLCFAVCGLDCCAENNSENTKPWHFPLAAALAHGSRILLKLSKVRADEFMNVVRFGKRDAWNWESGTPSPLYSRVVATHGVKLSSRRQICEIKPNASQVLAFKHIGLDVPLGGFGNPAPPRGEEFDVELEDPEARLFIGPAGVPYKEKGDWIQFVDSIQNGHLYMLMHDFRQDLEGSESLSAILIGVEGSSPMKTNFFGSRHTTEATSNKFSAFGKRKWRDYRSSGQGVPAEMGGIQMHVDEERLLLCEEVIEKMSLCKPSGDLNADEMHFFQRLLQGCDAEVAKALNEKFGDIRRVRNRMSQSTSD